MISSRYSGGPHSQNFLGKSFEDFLSSENHRIIFSKVLILNFLRQVARYYVTLLLNLELASGAYVWLVLFRYHLRQEIFLRFS